MAGFAFTVPVQTSVDLQLTLLVNSQPFNISELLAHGTAVLSLTVNDGIAFQWSSSTGDIVNAAGNATNVATIHVVAGQLTRLGVYSAAFSTTTASWSGTVTIAAAGEATESASTAPNGIYLAPLDAQLVTITGGISARSAASRAGDRPTPFDFGAIADGSSHPLSTRYATLAASQAVYPFVTALTQEIDWAAIQAAINWGPVNGGPVGLPGSSIFVSSSPLVAKALTQLEGVNATSTMPTWPNTATVLTFESAYSGLGTSTYALDFRAGGAGFRSSIRNLCVKGPQSGGVGIIMGGTEPILDNVRVDGFTYGVNLYGVAGAHVNRLWVEAPATIGMLLSASAGNVRVMDSRFQNAGQALTSGAVANLYISSSSHDVFIDCSLIDECFGAGSSAVLIDGGVNRVTMLGTRVYVSGYPTKPGYGINIDSAGAAPTNVKLISVWVGPYDGSRVPTNTIRVTGSGHAMIDVQTNPNGGGDINDLASDTTWINVNGKYKIPSLPSSNPGTGSKQLWYDPADSNRVKFGA